MSSGSPETKGHEINRLEFCHLVILIGFGAALALIGCNPKKSEINPEELETWGVTFKPGVDPKLKVDGVFEIMKQSSDPYFIQAAGTVDILKSRDSFDVNLTDLPSGSSSLGIDLQYGFSVADQKPKTDIKLYIDNTFIQNANPQELSISLLYAINFHLRSLPQVLQLQQNYNQLSQNPRDLLLESAKILNNPDLKAQALADTLITVSNENKNTGLDFGNSYVDKALSVFEKFDQNPIDPRWIDWVKNNP